MLTAIIKNIPLELHTDSEVFSPSDVDRGTLAMLSKTEFKAGDRVLDLGCGCGVVGILAAVCVGAENVTMCDVSEKAVELSKLNALQNGVDEVKILQSDGFSRVDGSFTLVLSNPPYHTDFSVAKAFIEGAFQALETGGKMIMVTKRLDWYKNKLAAVFGGVRVSEIDGYYVLESEKRAVKPKKPKKNKNALSKKLARKAGIKKSAVQ